MYFSSMLWLMVIECSSVFLFGFDYLPVFVGKCFSLVPFLFFHQFFYFSPPDVPHTSGSLSYFF